MRKNTPTSFSYFWDNSKNIKQHKLCRYGLLRYVPGKIGHYYSSQYLRLITPYEFERALHQVAGLTSIDLGANVGKYTKILATHSKQVIAFEPDPFANARLRENTSDYDNVNIEESAAGTNDGTVFLYRTKNFYDDPIANSVSSSILPIKRYMNIENKILVRQVNFIEYLERLNNDIGILKIDIEGMEVELLEALFEHPTLLQKIKFIFTEMHDKQIPNLKSRVAVLREHVVRNRLKGIFLYWH